MSQRDTCAVGRNMDLLTWLLMFFGLAFAICLRLLVKTTGDLSHVSVCEAPAIRVTLNKTATAKERSAKAIASSGSRPTESSDAQ